MKKIIIIFCFLIPFAGSTQTDVKKNYTKPYFQSNVRVVDTLGVDNLLRFGDNLLGPFNTILKNTTNNPFGQTQTLFNLVHNDQIVYNVYHGITTPVHSTYLQGTTGTNTYLFSMNSAGNFDFNWDNGVTDNRLTFDFTAASMPRIDFVDNNGTFKTSLTGVLPTADRLITLPDNSGTVALLSDIPAGSGNLQSVLTIGNTSGGNNISLTAGDYLEFGTTNGTFLRNSLNNIVFQQVFGADLYISNFNTNSNIALEVNAAGSNILLNSTLGKIEINSALGLDVKGSTIQLSDESGDIQAISTLAGDIIISSDAYSLRVETDAGLNVLNGITSQTTISSLGNIIFASNGLSLKYNEVGPGFTGDLRKLTLTASRLWDLPDKSGTLATLSDITAPTSSGIYAGSGSLSGSVTVTMGANEIEFTANTPASKVVIGQTLNKAEITMYDFGGLIQNYFQTGATGMSFFKDKLAVGQLLGIGATLDVLGDFRVTSTGTETAGYVMTTSANGLASWTDPATLGIFQTSVGTGNTTTILSAFDFAGGTTIMNSMSFTSLDAGTYLVSFGTSFSQSVTGQNIHTILETNGAAVAGSERNFGIASTQIIGLGNYSQFPVVVAQGDDINLHWIELTGGTATSLLGRNITIQKIN